MDHCIAISPFFRVNFSIPKIGSSKICQKKQGQLVRNPKPSLPKSFKSIVFLRCESVWIPKLRSSRSVSGQVFWEGNGSVAGTKVFSTLSEVHEQKNKWLAAWV